MRVYRSNTYSKCSIWGSRPLEKTLKFHTDSTLVLGKKLGEFPKHYMGPTPILEKTLGEFPK
jgi:hypothetical protein